MGQHCPLCPSAPSAPSRIGIFVCRCGGEIGDLVDVDAVAAEVHGWPGVAFAESIPFACHEEGAAAIRQAIVEAGLDRVVLAACSCCSLDKVCDSCTYQRVRCKVQTSDVKRETSNVKCQMAGGFEFVNIREQCAWVHADQPAAAAAKARNLIASAVAKVRQDEARARTVVPLDKSVLVVGNGISSAVCADTLKAQGFRVFRTESPPLSVRGSIGNFTAVMPESGGERELRIGAMVLASEGELDIGYWGLEIGNPGVFSYDLEDGRDRQVWGLAVAARVAALLGKGWAVVEPIVAAVDATRCRA